MKVSQLLILSISCFTISCVSRTDDSLFRLVTPGRSNIAFDNRIIENDTINPFDVINMYNGAGVGIGDFNNDGYLDIYFAGNQVACQLYLNMKNLEFRDVTPVAKVNGNGKWCRGVAVVDINNDGRQDIYVCATIYSSPEQRKNLLYVNQGNNGDGIPLFKEMSAEYGLDTDSHCT